jgi:enoyl-CoA hydratase
MNETTSVRLEFDNTIARIIFDQPNARANTLSTAVWSDFADALTEIAPRRDLSGAIISSAKDGIFIAGADLKELRGLIANQQGLTRRLLTAGLNVLAALEAMPFPTVAMIDGAALGGGLEVALACDYRVAGSHPKCKLGLPEVKLGLIPGWGGTQRLPRLVGLATGADMLIAGRTYTPLEAFAIGLIDDAVPSDQLAAAAAATLARDDWSARRSKRANPGAGDMPTDWSAQLAQLSDDERPVAEVALRVVAEGAKLPLHEATGMETDAFIPLLQSDAARRRIEGFLKK